MVKALLAFYPWIVKGQTLTLTLIYSAVLRSIMNISLKFSSYFANNQS